MTYQRIGSYDIWIKKEEDNVLLRFEWLSEGSRFLELAIDTKTIKYSDNGTYRQLSVNSDKGLLEIVKTPLGITKLKLIKWKIPIFWGKGKEAKGLSIIDELVSLEA